MKTKIMLLLLNICLSMLISAQDVAIPDGLYRFEKAILVIQKYETSEILSEEVQTDIDAITTNSIHWSNVILALEIEHGKFRKCMLLNRKEYELDSMGILQPLKTKEYEQKEAMADVDQSFPSVTTNIAPYQLIMEGDKLILSFFKYNFGQSDINYTMTASLKVIMTKQNQ